MAGCAMAQRVTLKACANGNSGELSVEEWNLMRPMLRIIRICIAAPWLSAARIETRESYRTKKQKKRRPKPAPGVFHWSKRATFGAGRSSEDRPHPCLLYSQLGKRQQEWGSATSVSRGNR
jgi:hypothetical protein